ncbi:MAG: aminoglycoside phosphotransferase family protein [Gammaproteobacteria bacterium]|nr:aminoglycoside phosphotransferase family protein [Gammaproteobacteria bacterium]
MTIINLVDTLSTIKTFEDFEKVKQDISLWETMANEIILHHKLSIETLQLCEEGTNIVFYYGDNLIIKIFPPFHFDQFNSERLVLKHLQEKLSAPTPELKYQGEVAGWPYLIMTRLHGTILEGRWEKLTHDNKLIIIQELGQLIREVHELPISDLNIDCSWQDFINKQIINCAAQHENMRLAKILLPEIPAYIEAAKNTLYTNTPVLLTGEYTPMNFLVTQTDGRWHISGLFDFGDAMLGLAQYDLLGPGAFLIQGDKELMKAFLMAYGYKSNELTATLSQHLTALDLLHQYSDLDKQIRINNWQSKVNGLKDLENLLWGFN